MPIYEFHCEKCAVYQEELQSMNEEHVSYCKRCGCKMDRIFSPAYLMGDLPQTGATVMGWDEHLGCEVRGRAHHKQLMEQRGLTEYVPDPEWVKCRDEARYIEKHDAGPTGRAAANKVRQKLGRKRREQIVRSKIEGAIKGKEIG